MTVHKIHENTKLPCDSCVDENEEHAISMITSAENFPVVSEMFKQLSDPTRMRIFIILYHAEICVLNLASVMNMSSPAVSHHLRMLKTSGLITCRRVGKQVLYTIADNDKANALHEAIEKMLNIYSDLHDNNN